MILLVLAVVVPISTKLVQQSTENRGKATGILSSETPVRPDLGGPVTTTKTIDTTTTVISKAPEAKTTTKTTTTTTTTTTNNGKVAYTYVGNIAYGSDGSRYVFTAPGVFYQDTSGKNVSGSVAESVANEVNHQTAVSGQKTIEVNGKAMTVEEAAAYAKTAAASTGNGLASKEAPNTSTGAVETAKASDSACGSGLHPGDFGGCFDAEGKPNTDPAKGAVTVVTKVNGFTQVTVNGIPMINKDGTVNQEAKQFTAPKTVEDAEKNIAVIKKIAEDSLKPGQSGGCGSGFYGGDNGGCFQIGTGKPNNCENFPDSCAQNGAITKVISAKDNSGFPQIVVNGENMITNTGGVNTKAKVFTAPQEMVDAAKQKATDEAMKGDQAKQSLAVVAATSGDKSALVNLCNSQSGNGTVIDCGSMSVGDLIKNFLPQYKDNADKIAASYDQIQIDTTVQKPIAEALAQGDKQKLVAQCEAKRMTDCSTKSIFELAKALLPLYDAAGLAKAYDQVQIDKTVQKPIVDALAEGDKKKLVAQCYAARMSGCETKTIGELAKSILPNYDPTAISAAYTDAVKRNELMDAAIAKAKESGNLKILGLDNMTYNVGLKSAQILYENLVKNGFSDATTASQMLWDLGIHQLNTTLGTNLGYIQVGTLSDLTAVSDKQKQQAVLEIKDNFYKDLVTDTSSKFYNPDEAARYRVQSTLATLGQLDNKVAAIKAGKTTWIEAEKELNTQLDNASNAHRANDSWETWTGPVGALVYAATDETNVVKWNTITGGRFKQGNDIMNSYSDPNLNFKVGNVDMNASVFKSVAGEIGSIGDVISSVHDQKNNWTTEDEKNAGYIRGVWMQGGDAAGAITLIAAAPLAPVMGVGLVGFLGTGVGVAAASQMTGHAAETCQNSGSTSSECLTSTALAVTSFVGVGTGALSQTAGVVTNAAGKLTVVGAGVKAAEAVTHVVNTAVFSKMALDSCIKAPGSLDCVSTGLMAASSLGRVVGGVGGAVAKIANASENAGVKSLIGGYEGMLKTVETASAYTFAASACAGLAGDGAASDKIGMCAMGLSGAVNTYAAKAAEAANARKAAETKMVAELNASGERMVTEEELAQLMNVKEAVNELSAAEQKIEDLNTALERAKKTGTGGASVDLIATELEKAQTELKTAETNRSKAVAEANKPIVNSNPAPAVQNPGVAINGANNKKDDKTDPAKLTDGFTQATKDLKTAQDELNTAREKQISALVKGEPVPAEVTGEISAAEAKVEAAKATQVAAGEAVTAALKVTAGKLDIVLPNQPVSDPAKLTDGFTQATKDLKTAQDELNTAREKQISALVKGEPVPAEVTGEISAAEAKVEAAKAAQVAAGEAVTAALKATADKLNAVLPNQPAPEAKPPVVIKKTFFENVGELVSGLTGKLFGGGKTVAASVAIAKDRVGMTTKEITDASGKARDAINADAEVTIYDNRDKLIAKESGYKTTIEEELKGLAKSSPEYIAKEAELAAINDRINTLQDMPKPANYDAVKAVRETFRAELGDKLTPEERVTKMNEQVKQKEAELKATPRDDRNFLEKLTGANKAKAEEKYLAKENEVLKAKKQLAQEEAIAELTKLRDAETDPVNVKNINDEINRIANLSEIKINTGNTALNTFYKNIISNHEVKMQRDGMAGKNNVFSVDSSQTRAYLDAMATPDILLEFALAGGKTTVIGPLLMKTGEMLYGRTGEFIAAEGQSAQAFNDMVKALTNQELVVGSDGKVDVSKITDVVLVDKIGNDLLGLRDRVMKATHVVTETSVPGFLETMIDNGTGTPAELDAAREILGKLRKNVTVFADEAHLNFDPGKIFVGSGENGKPLDSWVKVGVASVRSALNDLGILTNGKDVNLAAVNAGGKRLIAVGTDGQSQFTKEGRAAVAEKVADNLGVPVDKVVEIFEGQGKVTQVDGLNAVQVQSVLDNLEIMNEFGRRLSMRRGSDFAERTNTDGGKKPNSVLAKDGVAQPDQQISSQVGAAVFETIVSEVLGKEPNLEAVNIGGKSAKAAFASHIDAIRAEDANSSLAAGTGTIGRNKGTLESAYGLATRTTNEILETFLGTRGDQGKISEKNISGIGVNDGTPQTKQAIIDKSISKVAEIKQAAVGNNNNAEVVLGGKDIAPDVWAREAAKSSEYRDGEGHVFIYRTENNEWMQMTVDAAGNQMGEVKDVGYEYSKKVLDNPETKNTTVIIGEGGATGTNVQAQDSVPGIDIISTETGRDQLDQSAARIGRKKGSLQETSMLVIGKEDGPVSKTELRSIADSVQAAQNQQNTYQAVSAAIDISGSKVLKDIIMNGKEGDPMVKLARQALIDLQNPPESRSYSFEKQEQSPLDALKSQADQVNSVYKEISENGKYSELYKQLKANNPELLAQVEANAKPVEFKFAENGSVQEVKEGVFSAGNLSEVMDIFGKTITVDLLPEKVAGGPATNKTETVFTKEAADQTVVDNTGFGEELGNPEAKPVISKEIAVVPNSEGTRLTSLDIIRANQLGVPLNNANGAPRNVADIQAEIKQKQTDATANTTQLDQKAAALGTTRGKTETDADFTSRLGDIETFYNANAAKYPRNAGESSGQYRARVNKAEALLAAAKDEVAKFGDVNETNLAAAKDLLTRALAAGLTESEVGQLQTAINNFVAQKQLAEDNLKAETLAANTRAKGLGTVRKADETNKDLNTRLDGIEAEYNGDFKRGGAESYSAYQARKAASATLAEAKDALKNKNYPMNYDEQDAFDAANTKAKVAALENKILARIKAEEAKNLVDLKAARTRGVNAGLAADVINGAATITEIDNLISQKQQADDKLKAETLAADERATGLGVVRKVGEANDVLNKRLDDIFAEYNGDFKRNMGESYLAYQARKAAAATLAEVKDGLTKKNYAMNDAEKKLFETANTKAKVAALENKILARIKAEKAAEAAKIAALVAAAKFNNYDLGDITGLDSAALGAKFDAIAATVKQQKADKLAQAKADQVAYDREQNKVKDKVVLPAVAELPKLPDSGLTKQQIDDAEAAAAADKQKKFDDAKAVAQKAATDSKTRTVELDARAKKNHLLRDIEISNDDFASQLDQIDKWKTEGWKMEVYAPTAFSTWQMYIYEQILSAAANAKKLGDTGTFDRLVAEMGAMVPNMQVGQGINVSKETANAFYGNLVSDTKNFGITYVDKAKGVLTKLFKKSADPSAAKDNRTQVEFYQNNNGKHEFIQFRGLVGGGFQQTYFDNTVSLGEFTRSGGVLTVEMVNNFLAEMKKIQDITGQAHGDLLSVSGDHYEGTFGVHPSNVLVQKMADGSYRLVPIDFAGSSISNRIDLTAEKTKTDELSGLKNGLGILAVISKAKSEGLDLGNVNGLTLDQVTTKYDSAALAAAEKKTQVKNTAIQDSAGERNSFTALMSRWGAMEQVIKDGKLIDYLSSSKRGRYQFSNGKYQRKTATGWVDLTQDEMNDLMNNVVYHFMYQSTASTGTMMFNASDVFDFYKIGVDRFKSVFKSVVDTGFGLAGKYGKDSGGTALAYQGWLRTSGNGWNYEEYAPGTVGRFYLNPNAQYTVDVFNRLVTAMRDSGIPFESKMLELEDLADESSRLRADKMVLYFRAEDSEKVMAILQGVYGKAETELPQNPAFAAFKGMPVFRKNINLLQGQVLKADGTVMNGVGFAQDYGAGTSFGEVISNSIAALIKEGKTLETITLSDIVSRFDATNETPYLHGNGPKLFGAIVNKVVNPWGDLKVNNPSTTKNDSLKTQVAEAAKVQNQQQKTLGGQINDFYNIANGDVVAARLVVGSLGISNIQHWKDVYYAILAVQKETSFEGIDFADLDNSLRNFIRQKLIANDLSLEKVIGPIVEDLLGKVRNNYIDQQTLENGVKSDQINSLNTESAAAEAILGVDNFAEGKAVTSTAKVDAGVILDKIKNGGLPIGNSFVNQFVDTLIRHSIAFRNASGKVLIDGKGITENKKNLEKMFLQTIKITNPEVAPAIDSYDEMVSSNKDIEAIQAQVFINSVVQNNTKAFFDDAGNAVSLEGYLQSIYSGRVKIIRTEVSPMDADMLSVIRKGVKNNLDPTVSADASSLEHVFGNGFPISKVVVENNGNIFTIPIISVPLENKGVLGLAFDSKLNGASVKTILINSEALKGGRSTLLDVFKTVVHEVDHGVYMSGIKDNTEMLLEIDRTDLASRYFDLLVRRGYPDDVIKRLNEKLYSRYSQQRRDLYTLPLEFSAEASLARMMDNMAKGWEQKMRAIGDNSSVDWIKDIYEVDKQLEIINHEVGIAYKGADTYSIVYTLATLIGKEYGYDQVWKMVFDGNASTWDKELNPLFNEVKRQLLTWYDNANLLMDATINPDLGGLDQGNMASVASKNNVDNYVEQLKTDKAGAMSLLEKLIVDRFGSDYQMKPIGDNVRELVALMMEDPFVIDEVKTNPGWQDDFDKVVEKLSGNVDIMGQIMGIDQFNDNDWKMVRAMVLHAAMETLSYNQKLLASAAKNINVIDGFNPEVNLVDGKVTVNFESSYNVKGEDGKIEKYTFRALGSVKEGDGVLELEISNDFSEKRIVISRNFNNDSDFPQSVIKEYKNRLAIDGAATILWDQIHNDEIDENIVNRGDLFRDMEKITALVVGKLRESGNTNTNFINMINTSGSGSIKPEYLPDYQQFVNVYSAYAVRSVKYVDLSVEQKTLETVNAEFNDLIKKLGYANDLESSPYTGQKLTPTYLEQKVDNQGRSLQVVNVESWKKQKSLLEFEINNKDLLKGGNVYLGDVSSVDEAQKRLSDVSSNQVLKVVVESNAVPQKTDNTNTTTSRKMAPALKAQIQSILDKKAELESKGLSQATQAEKMLAAFNQNQISESELADTIDSLVILLRMKGINIDNPSPSDVLKEANSGLDELKRLKLAQSLVAIDSRLDKTELSKLTVEQLADLNKKYQAKFDENVKLAKRLGVAVATTDDLAKLENKIATMRDDLAKKKKAADEEAKIAWIKDEPEELVDQKIARVGLEKKATEMQKNIDKVDEARKNLKSILDELKTLENEFKNLANEGATGETRQKAIVLLGRYADLISNLKQWREKNVETLGADDGLKGIISTLETNQQQLNTMLVNNTAAYSTTMPQDVLDNLVKVDKYVIGFDESINKQKTTLSTAQADIKILSNKIKEAAAAIPRVDFQLAEGKIAMPEVDQKVANDKAAAKENVETALAKLKSVVDAATNNVKSTNKTISSLETMNNELLVLAGTFIDLSGDIKQQKIEDLEALLANVKKYADNLAEADDGNRDDALDQAISDISTALNDLKNAVDEYGCTPGFSTCSIRSQMVKNNLNKADQLAGQGDINGAINIINQTRNYVNSHQYSNVLAQDVQNEKVEVEHLMIVKTAAERDDALRAIQLTLDRVNELDKRNNLTTEQKNNLDQTRKDLETDKADVENTKVRDSSPLEYVQTAIGRGEAIIRQKTAPLNQKAREDEDKKVEENNKETSLIDGKTTNAINNIEKTLEGLFNNQLPDTVSNRIKLLRDGGKIKTLTTEEKSKLSKERPATAAYYSYDDDVVYLTDNTDIHTLIHEILHFISRGVDGKTGFYGYGSFLKLSDRSRIDRFRLFNEGVTEMLTTVVENDLDVTNEDNWSKMFSLYNDYVLKETSTDRSLADMASLYTNQVSRFEQYLLAGEKSSKDTGLFISLFQEYFKGKGIDAWVDKMSRQTNDKTFVNKLAVAIVEEKGYGELVQFFQKAVNEMVVGGVNSKTGVLLNNFINSLNSGKNDNLELTIEHPENLRFQNYEVTDLSFFGLQRTLRLSSYMLAKIKSLNETDRDNMIKVLSYLVDSVSRTGDFDFYNDNGFLEFLGSNRIDTSSETIIYSFFKVAPTEEQRSKMFLFKLTSLSVHENDVAKIDGDENCSGPFPVCSAQMSLVRSAREKALTLASNGNFAGAQTVLDGAENYVHSHKMVNTAAQLLMDKVVVVTDLDIFKNQVNKDRALQVIAAVRAEVEKMKTRPGLTAVQKELLDIEDVDLNDESNIVKDTEVTPSNPGEKLRALAKAGSLAVRETVIPNLQARVLESANYANSVVTLPQSMAGEQMDLPVIVESKPVIPALVENITTAGNSYMPMVDREAKLVETLVAKAKTTLVAEKVQMDREKGIAWVTGYLVGTNKGVLVKGTPERWMVNIGVEEMKSMADISAKDFADKYIGDADSFQLYWHGYGANGLVYLDSADTLLPKWSSGKKVVGVSLSIMGAEHTLDLNGKEFTYDMAADQVINATEELDKALGGKFLSKLEGATGHSMGGQIVSKVALKTAKDPRWQKVKFASIAPVVDATPEDLKIFAGAGGAMTYVTGRTPGVLHNGIMVAGNDMRINSAIFNGMVGGGEKNITQAVHLYQMMWDPAFLNNVTQMLSNPNGKLTAEEAAGLAELSRLGRYQMFIGGQDKILSAGSMANYAGLEILIKVIASSGHYFNKEGMQAVSNFINSGKIVPVSAGKIRVSNTQQKALLPEEKFAPSVLDLFNVTLWSNKKKTMSGTNTLMGIEGENNCTSCPIRTATVESLVSKADGLAVQGKTAEAIPVINQDQNYANSHLYVNELAQDWQNKEIAIEYLKIAKTAARKDNALRAIQLTIDRANELEKGSDLTAEQKTTLENAKKQLETDRQNVNETIVRPSNLVEWTQVAVERSAMAIRRQTAVLDQKGRSVEDEKVEKQFDHPYTVDKSVDPILKSWGVDSSVVSKLIDVASKYTYFEPLARLELLLREPLATIEERDHYYKNGSWYFDMNYPIGWDYRYEVEAGECSEVACRTINNPQTKQMMSGYSGKLRLVGLSGLSPTHFNVEGSQHIFLGLMTEEMYRDKKYDDMIIFDPAFRVFVPLNGSGYVVKDIIDTSKQNKDNGDWYTFMTTMHFVGNIDENFKLEDYKDKDRGFVHVLGASNDGNYIYYLGYALEGENHLIPFVELGDENSNTVAIYILNSKGELNSNNKDLVLARDTGDTVVSLLKKAEEITLSDKNIKVGSKQEGSNSSENKILGAVDPRTLTKEQFDKSPDLLFHGAEKDFVYSPDGQYESNGNGSADYGLGFYTTNDLEQAKNYSVVRDSNNMDKPIVYNFLPYKANMLDVRNPNDLENNVVLPSGFVNGFLAYFEGKYNDPKALYPLQTNEKIRKGLYENVLREINRLRADVSSGKGLLIRENNVSAGIFTDGDNSGALSSVFRDYMLSLGYDGMIYVEGGEGKSSQNLTGYVFYNPKVINTWDGWQKEKISTQETVVGLDAMAESNPMVAEMFSNKQLIAALPSSISTNSNLMEEYRINTAKMFILEQKYPEIVFKEEVSEPEHKLGNGKIRKAQTGKRIDVKAIATAGVNLDRVLVFRVTINGVEKPEDFWTTDFYETVRGLSVEIPEKNTNPESVKILVSTLADIASDTILTQDVNDDNGLPVMRLGNLPYLQSRALNIASYVDILDIGIADIFDMFSSFGNTIKNR